MLNVSAGFKAAMKSPMKEIRAYIKKQDDTYIRSEDDLISFKLSGEGSLGKTVMRAVEAKFLGSYDLLGQTVRVGLGVRIAGGTFEYADFGSFIITEAIKDIATESTTVKGYDLMLKTMQPYSVFAAYPTTVEGFVAWICEVCGIVPGIGSYPNMAWELPAELYENIKGITYRDILTQVAEASGTVAMIGADDKLYFKSITETSETLAYANLFKLKSEPHYGPINSVVLSRQPAEDNVVLVDQASIDTDGLTEFKIENNWLLDRDREAAITPLFNQLHGTVYHPFEAATEGLGWYEVGDRLQITDSDVDISVVVFGFTLSVDGSLKEILFAKAETKTATNYSYAGTVGRKLANTEIKVDKQGQDIALLTEQLASSTILKQQTAPDNPQTEALWLNTTDNVIYRFDGTAWQPTSINPEALLDYYTKSEIDIKDGSITSTVEQTSAAVTNLSTDINNNYFTAAQVEALTGQNTGEITRLKTDITTMQQTAQGLQVQITDIVDNGTSKVTNTLVNVDSNGVGISKTGEEMSLKLGYLADQQVGLEVTRNDEKVLQVTNTGVEAENVKVRKYLIIGNNSRMEDYQEGTGIFYIGT